MKFKRVVNYIFLFLIFIIIFYGTLRGIIKPSDKNYYENRSATKYMDFSVKSFINEEFQNNIEETLSDQLPTSVYMKKYYNFAKNLMSKNITSALVKNNCSNNYIYLSNSILTYGCDEYLVYNKYNFDDIKDVLDTEIQNVNHLIEKNLADVYVYYIEKDTDINFKTGEKTGVSEYLQANLKTNNYKTFTINSFEEYQKSFYKTDHHWNYYGSYKGYLEVASLFGIEDTINISDKYCFNNSFSGSKASFSGAAKLYNEEFCVYTFEVKEHKTYSNKEEVSDYGKPNMSKKSSIGYGTYYGGDDGEVIFDYNDDNKVNLLVFGNSYDNAIVRNLSSHFNKTFVIDLRNYKNNIGEEFNYEKYIKENKIDKVLIVGDLFYFANSDFLVED